MSLTSITSINSTSNTGLQTTSDMTSVQKGSSSDPQIFLESSQSNNQTNNIQVMGKQIQNGCPSCSCPIQICPIQTCPIQTCSTCTDPYNVCPEKLFITQENLESVYIPQECPKQICPKQEDTSSWKISVYILGGLLFLCVIVVLLLLRKKKGQQ